MSTVKMSDMNRQCGFSLIMVLATMIILSLGSAMFLSRSSDDMGIGGSRRDSGLAQRLAEETTNLVVGRFNSQDVATADISGNGIADRVEGYADISTSPAVLPLPYAFYSGAGTTQIVQRIATGESTQTSNPANAPGISSAVTEMNISDLFVSGTVHPLVFTQSVAGIALSANAWSAETAKNKSAVWIEYEVNSSNSAWVDLYVAAAGQVGVAKAFTRKFLGSYTDQLGGMISPITESAIHGTSDVP